MDQAYQDKLDGRIPEDFWERKMAEWMIEERSIQDALLRLEQPTDPKSKQNLSAPKHEARFGYVLIDELNALS